jgi:hypothetical protein
VAIGAVVLAACGAVALWPSDRHAPARQEVQAITDGGRSVPYRPLTVPEPPAEPVAWVAMPVDVRGATGTVVLMERGTRIVGEVRSALARGSRRLFG